MIYVDRHSVKKPSVLESEKMIQEFEKMKHFHLDEGIKSDFRRYKFSSMARQPKIKDALKTLFNDKCAYCESKVSTTGYGDVELFRPKDGAMNIDGSFDTDHYWWLAYEWSNMYFSCSVCNQRYKRNSFPVKGKRAEIMGDLSVENPLLIDPCNREDFLEQHIGYEKERAIGLTKKGATTIKILGLNRDELLLQRKKALKQLEHALSNYSQTPSKENYRTLESIWDMTDKDSPYLACKWGNYWKQLMEVYSGNPPEYLPFYKKHVSYSVEESNSQIQEPTIQVKKPARKSYSLDKLNVDAKNEYFSQSRWITKVRIKNFKIIENLELKFSNANAINKVKNIQEPWMALLGENGTGKSTVLQAIALTLAGQERLDKLNLNPAKFVNRNVEEDHGWVKVYLNDRKTPITLNFSKSSDTFDVSPKAPQLIVRAYGSTRLFSDDTKDLHDKDFSFIENLFDPLELLLNGNEWLIEKIGDEKLFPEIAKSLGDLLSLNEEQYFYPDEDHNGNPIVSLQLYPNKKGIPLDDLSAGYKAILALALDIMMGFGKIWPSIFNAQGIVLVDEIGVHLHPRWKMRIIDALRNTFPGINFVIATHEPLCLRGLEKGEVILIRLDENKEIEIITELPSPKRMQVGQLLTSVFGLHTTLDPKLERLFTEFNELQSLRKHTTIQEERFEELKVQLEDHLIEDPLTGELRPNTLLGETMDEAITYKAIEQEYAKKDKRTLKDDIEALSKEKLDKIKALWRNN